MTLSLLGCTTRGSLDGATRVSPLCRSIGAFTAYAASPERCGGEGSFSVPEGGYPGSAEPMAAWLAQEWESDEAGWFAALDACGLVDHDAFPTDTADCEANASCLAEHGLTLPETWGEVDTAAYDRVCASPVGTESGSYAGDAD